MIITLPYTPQDKQKLLHGTPAKQIFYGGAAGGGKDAPLDSTVWTPFGPKKMGDIQIGDQVSNPCGGVSRVIALWPQGVKQVYRVTFDDGASCEVGAHHLWKVRDASKRRFRKRESDSSENWRIATTLQIAGRLEKHNQLIPLTAPVEFTVSSRYPDGRWPVPPYVLGALLGDGYLGEAQTSLTCADAEIAFRFSELGWHPHHIATKEANAASTYFFSAAHREVLGKLWLNGKRSWEKFVPGEYKIAPASMRWELLRGLMDTDGYADDRGHASYTSTSQRLADDVVFLARSLGFKAHHTNKKTYFVGRDGKKEGRISYTVWIKGGNHGDLFSLERKRARAARPYNGGASERTRRIVSIEPSRMTETQCITVDHPSGLYLTDDFIVTHNSHSIRWDAITFCLENPGLDAFLFRRTLGELEDNHIRKMKAELPAQLGSYNETRKRFEFYNGAGLNFCYCEKESDVTRYQGAEIHWLGVDEAAHLTEYQLTYLRSRVRLGSWKPNPKHAHLLPRIVYGSNPGGPGHQFLKSTFIDPAPPMTYFRDSSMADPKNPEDRGWLSVYIPARMADNSYLDKSYAGQFRALSPELARALTEGDWDAVVGAALHNLSRERHQLRAFSPPRHWTRFMAIDWGTARPFSVGWYAVSDGATLAAKDGWPERQLPAGAVIRYAEWYGTDGRPNHGSRLSADQVALGILQREKERGEPDISYRVGDHQMWAQHDGPSPRERMFVATEGRINLRKSKKDRKVNYAEVIARLAGNPKFSENGETWEPMFFVTANCTQFWRTCPPLILDETDPDKGPGTDQEDHVYDEVQYALASRPFTQTKEEFEDVRPKMRIDPYATA